MMSGFHYNGKNVKKTLGDRVSGEGFWVGGARHWFDEML
jgi:hypothetical protein